MPRGAPTTELVTALFTDIVRSTEIAAEVGDGRWRELVAAHHALVRERLKRHRGREQDTAGDGFFAVFARPAEAIRCAIEIGDGVRELGLEIRAGLHLGEAEVMGPKVGGVAVNTAARIMALGKAGEVLVSATVRDAVAGKGIDFTDHGSHQLKGLEGEFRVFDAVAVDGHARGLPLDPDEARRRREEGPAGAATRRGPWWLVAAGVGVLAAAGIGLALSLGGSDPGDPALTGPSASGSGRTLTEADAQVIELVPTAFAQTCGATDPLPKDAVGSVTCLDGENEVRYDTFADADALSVAFASATAGLDLPGTSCLADRAASGTSTMDGGSPGRVACFVEQPTVLAHASTIVWTDDAFLVLGRVTREDLTEYPVNAPDLTLYEWWRTEAGPGPGGSFRPKDGSAELPSGVFELEVTEDEVGAQSDGLADERWLGITTVELDGDTFRVVYADGGSYESDLLWGKGDRLVSRARGELGTDFDQVQCPRYESWTWRLEGEDLVLSDPSPGACNDLRNLLAFEPLVRVG